MKTKVLIFSGGKEGGWDSRREGGKSCHGGGEEIKKTFMRDILREEKKERWNGYRKSQRDQKSEINFHNVRRRTKSSTKKRRTEKEERHGKKRKDWR